MRYLFFTNTPAHVHLYKNAVDELHDRGHEVTVLGRDYGCTLQLLEDADLNYEIYGNCETTKYSLFRELPDHYVNIFRKARSFQPDLIFGYGAYSAHAGAITQTPVISIFDSEPTTLDHLISKPFSDALITPAAFRKSLGEKHYTFNGFKETAYLHPETFESSQTEIREALGLNDDDPYVILRLNAFGSHHDVGEAGFSTAQKKQLAEELNRRAEVFISDEGNQLDFDDIEAREFSLHPAKMHDALAHADLLIADTQTMVTEAALLGTPAIRSNSFVGESDMGNFIDLEENGLIHNETEFQEVLTKAIAILEDPDSQSRWKRRREAYIKDKVNLTELIVDIATEYAESGRSINEVIQGQERLVAHQGQARLVAQ